MPTIKEDHSGHRQRIFQRMDKNIPEHELLEALLFSLIPRRNTNNLAHRLLERFGSIYEVFAASVEDLKSVEGIGDSIAHGIRCNGVFMEKYFESIVRLFVGKFNAREFAAYIRRNYIEEHTEFLELYLLNQAGEAFQRYRFVDGEQGFVFLPTNKLAKILVQEKPYGIVMTHNHPNGYATPSARDDSSTLAVQEICLRHGVRLCDHIVYGGNNVYSYVLENRVNPKNNMPYVMGVTTRTESGRIER